MQINPLFVTIVAATKFDRAYHEKPEPIEGSEPIEIHASVWEPKRRLTDDERLTRLQIDYESGVLLALMKSVEFQPVVEKRFERVRLQQAG